MITARLSEDRGKTQYGNWLNSHHTFSFGHYYDQDHMGFGPLRVINEDWVQPGAGFDAHGHQDMEIISYVIDGALEHKDSMGNGSVIRAGEVQRMSAGTGVVHSEYNASSEAPVHFLQIWIEPKAWGLTPGYDQKSFGHISPEDGFVLAASGDGRDGSVALNQNADVYLAAFSTTTVLEKAIGAGRNVWSHVISGDVTVNGIDLASGDAIALTGETSLSVAGTSDGKLLVFELEA